MARDSGNPPLEGVSVLQIEIIDVNEHRPVIHPSKYNSRGRVHTAHPNITRVYVQEGSSVAKQLVYTVVATDGDRNNILRYSMTGWEK